MLRKIFSKLLQLRSYYVTRPSEQAISDHFSYSSESSAHDTPIIVLQCVEDYFYIGAFGAVVAGLRRHIPLRADQYMFRSLRHGEYGSWKGWLWTRFAVNGLSDRKWQRLYGAFCDGDAVRSAAWLSPLAELRIWRQARDIQRSFQDKDQFAALTVRGILIGDLVIDSYIRFRPRPDFQATDPYVRRILRQVLRDLDKAFAYFQSRKPCLFLTSYTSYIQHGVPARVAVALGVKVMSFGNYQQVAKNLSLADQTHLAEHWNYGRRFDALPLDEQNTMLAMADSRLSARMQGEIDNAIGYMRSSAYARTAVELPDVKGAVIVYLPDFYDNVHAYRWSVFHDFWDWTCFTIETLAEAKIPFFIKGHPNVALDSRFVYDLLREKYPHAQFLAPGITTAQLVDAGMACGVSARGTVLSELSYLGVPVVPGGDHPHAAFDLEEPPRTVAEYRRRLLGNAHLPRDPARMKRNACIFYSMHNLRSDDDEIALRDKWLDLRGMTFYGLPPDIAAFLSGLAELERLPYFRKLVAQWAHDIRENGQTERLPQTVNQAA